MLVHKWNICAEALEAEVQKVAGQGKVLSEATFAAALIMAGPPISMFSIPSSNEIPLEEEAFA